MMSKNGMPKADFVMSLFLMAFGIWVIWESLRLPTFEKDWGGFYAAPGFVPLILGIVISGMSLALFIRALKQQGHKIIPDRSALNGFVRSKPVQRWCLAMAYVFGFFFLLGRVYFYLAAFLVLFAFMITFSEKKFIFVLIISSAASGLIYVVFSKIFLVPLP